MTTFENDLKESRQSSLAARHLAAHAIFALRAGFRVEQVTLDAISNAQSGVICAWKQAREAYADDAKLMHRGFAFTYIGGMINQENLQNPPDELRAEMRADMAASEDCRETVVAWNLVESVQETNAFARIGYKLASRLITREWFQENASPYSFDELEKTNTY